MYGVVQGTKVVNTRYILFRRNPAVDRQKLKINEGGQLASLVDSRLKRGPNPR